MPTTTPSVTLSQLSRWDDKRKPRQIKRMRQQEAMQQRYRAVDYPQPEPPMWKPLG